MSDFYQRGVARAQREQKEADRVLDYLRRAGADRREVQVSQAAIAEATGVRTDQVSLATLRLCRAGRLAMDRPREAMVAYTYRVVR